MPLRPPRLDRTSEVDRPTVEQQLLREGRLPRVRMRNDRKRPPPSRLQPKPLFFRVSQEIRYAVSRVGGPGGRRPAPLVEARRAGSTGRLTGHPAGALLRASMVDLTGIEPVTS